MKKVYSKAINFQNVISHEIGESIISSYKRALNILNNELKDTNLELSMG